MASIRGQGNAFEIRECVQTDEGPRQRPLARFRRILTPAVLAQAEAAASKPFDRAALIARARARGIPVSSTAQADEARRLVAYLRGGGEIDATLVTLLREALSARPGRAVPEHLEDATEWMGRSERERGRALRGLLRTASRVVRSRPALIEPDAEPFPHFSSGEGFA